MLLDTPMCEFEWKAPDFTLKDPDGREFSMLDMMGEKGLVIAFICNHCPYVKAMTTRLAADARQLAEEGVNVLGVMSNDYQAVPSDSPEQMKKFASENGFTFPYLVDEDQNVAKTYGAVCTPDFFGINASGRLQYRGRLDNLRMGDEGESDRQRDLIEAMRLVAQTGKGPKEQYPSMGCSIKWRS